MYLYALKRVKDLHHLTRKLRFISTTESPLIKVTKTCLINFISLTTTKKSEEPKLKRKTRLLTWYRITYKARIQRIEFLLAKNKVQPENWLVKMPNSKRLSKCKSWTFVSKKKSTIKWKNSCKTLARVRFRSKLHLGKANRLNLRPRKIIHRNKLCKIRCFEKKLGLFSIHSVFWKVIHLQNLFKNPLKRLLLKFQNRR
jgi:hypothetical protein